MDSAAREDEFGPSLSQPWKVRSAQALCLFLPRFNFRMCRKRLYHLHARRLAGEYVANHAKSPAKETPVTSTKKLVLCVGMIISFLTVSVYAQSADPKPNHFAAEGISFNYPSDYSVTDQSSPEAQQFLITRKGSSVQLTIFIPLRLVTPSTYTVAVEAIAQPMVKKVA